MSDRLLEAQRALTADYLAAMPRNVGLFREYLVAVASGDGDAEASLRKLAHRYAGSGGSYGFDEITKVARLVEHAPAADLEELVKAFIDVLERIVREASESG